MKISKQYCYLQFIIISELLLSIGQLWIPNTLKALNILGGAGLNYPITYNPNNITA